jgi:hypothetical protein
MKQDYTVYIRKADKRCKSGKRAVSTTVWRDQTAESMAREVTEIRGMFPASQGFIIEYNPSMKTVKNLMTGKDIQIAADTPWCCNPASESYWSM